MLKYIYVQKHVLLLCIAIAHKLLCSHNNYNKTQGKRYLKR